MCIIFVCNSRKPTHDQLITAYTNNPDGFGIAFLDTGHVRWRKGIYTIDEIIDIVDDTPLPALLHFRIATVGEVCKELCHPFPLVPGVPTRVCGAAHAVMAHNGHFVRWREMLIALACKDNKIPRGKWSDSRVLAWLMTQYGIYVVDKLALTEMNKIAVLNRRGFVLFGSWHKDTGFYVSNKSYMNEKLELEE